ncbi:hypothetical protein VTK26DRAFT_3179 [Humicola hyalothermophila]
MFPFSSWFGFKPATENGTKPPTATPEPTSPATATSNLSSNTGAAAAAPASTNETLPVDLLVEPHPPILSQRSLKQLGLFFGGAGFLSLSVLISRRAVARHQLAAQLKFFQPNSWKAAGPEGGAPPRKDPMVAIEALNLATLNTLSFFVMVAGGVSWALNISSVDDLKRITRRSIMRSAAGASDVEAEKQVIEWVAKTFGIEAKAEEQTQGQGQGREKEQRPGK